VLEVYTRPENLESVRKELEGHNVTIDSAELSLIPKNVVELDEKGALQALRLMDKLESLDDIQRVYSNADFPPEALDRYGEEN
jgi:transcriptional/translational regulatory protein YebC/TACO1